MNAIQISASGIGSPMERVDFEKFQLTENWLQETLFNNPTLINVQSRDKLDPIIPLCRELPLKGASSTVYVDLFGIRRSGTPVIVKCKLWRNPQARREVIGQILEYASLIRGFSSSDLEAIVLGSNNRIDLTNLFDAVTRQFPEDLESDFTDRVSSCLEQGNFDLIIAGDGIRSDLFAITDLLEMRGGNAASLSLLEVSVCGWESGERFVNSQVPSRFEVVKQRVLVAHDGQVVEVAENSEVEETIESSRDPEAQSRNRAFWDRFIESVHFDHPEQTKPRHGGVNWVKLDVPGPTKWITCYRSKPKTIGIFFDLRGEEGRRLYDKFLEQKSEFEASIPGIKFYERENWGKTAKNPWVSVETEAEIDNPDDEDQQIEWLSNQANRFISTFRPILSQSEKNQPSSGT